MRNQRTYDNATLLKPVGLISASVAGSTILDLGNGISRGNLVIQVTAMEVASGDEIYTVALEGSNVAAMTSGSVTLAEKQMGNVPAPADADTATGRHVIPFRNELNGVLYRYVRIYTTVAGAVDTGINFTANIEQE